VNLGTSLPFPADTNDVVSTGWEHGSAADTGDWDEGLTGRTIGRYRLVGKLAQGGMANIYIAVQEGIEGFTKIVVLKRVLPHLAKSKRFKAMFLDEARIAAQLHHPNVVATHELGESDGQYFIAMEYLPGEDVLSILRRCRKQQIVVPTRMACAIVQQCAEGLHYAHEFRDPHGNPMNLVHRDISPSNVIVTYHGDVKVLDFGIAKATMLDRGDTRIGGFKGKLAHSAPEQLVDGKIDRRTDVFALGILLWELLMTKPLFKRKAEALTVEAVRTAAVPLPSGQRSELPEIVDRIVMRALERDPDRRFASAEALASALDEYFALHANRPSARETGVWLTSLFGDEAAAVKRAVAQGMDLERNVAAAIRMSRRTKRSQVESALDVSEPVRTVTHSRPVWSTSAAGGSSITAQPSASFVDVSIISETVNPEAAPPRRSMGWVIGVCLAVLLAFGGLAFVLGGESESPANPVVRYGTVAVASTPPGAMVFVDGQPRGVFTPTVLSDLLRGRSVQIRVEKPGHVPKSATVEVGDKSKRLDFALQSTVGRVSFAGVPDGATLFIDDEPVAVGATVELEVGAHRLRVETPDDILTSKTIEVLSGTQTIEVMEGT
jgi:serine/threonine protein kinase